MSMHEAQNIGVEGNDEGHVLMNKEQARSKRVTGLINCIDFKWGLVMISHFYGPLDNEQKI